MADADPSQVLSDMSGKSGGSPLDDILKKRKALEGEQDKVAAEGEAMYEGQRKKVDKFTEEHQFPHPDVKPWTEAPPENNPVKSFGSWASTLGILASAMTRTPLTSALNASASAMTAIRANDLETYKEAKQAWKDNTEIALKNAEWEVRGYDNALDLMKTDFALGTAKWKAHAAATDNKAAMLIGDAGLVEHMQSYAASMASLRQRISEAAPGLREEADKQEYVLSQVQTKAAEYEQTTGKDPTPQQLAVFKMDARLELKAREATATHPAARFSASAATHQTALDWASKRGIPPEESDAKYAAYKAGLVRAAQNEAPPKDLTQKQVTDFKVKEADFKGMIEAVDKAKDFVARFGTGLTTDLAKLPLDRVMSQLHMSNADIAKMDDQLKLIRGKLGSGRLAQEYKDRAEIFNVRRPTEEVLGALEDIEEPIRLKYEAVHEGLQAFEDRQGGHSAGGVIPKPGSVIKFDAQGNQLP